MESKKNKLEINILRPFGPSIIKIKMPDELVIKMNEYVDTIIADQKKSIELDHGNSLAGNVNQEFILEQEFMKNIKWAEFLASACTQWMLSDQKRRIKSFAIIKSWIVRQFKNEYNPVHYHNGHVSGVGYLKVPKDMGKMVQETKKSNNNGKLVLIHGSKNLFSEPTLVIKPEVGDFYMFPNYLLHTVYPFSDTDEERRSVSFNGKLDDAAVVF
jgi:uncharacterized protein (TIGR02466 family)